MVIVLLGYMGSGKSIIAKTVAERLNFNTLDLDAYIEHQEKMSISDIFATKGEIYFRKKEHQYLAETLDCNTNIILSLGGGTPCYANNMELILEQTAFSFFLKTSINEIIHRVKNEKEKRPLIANIANEDLPEFIGKHLFERNPFYNKASFIITTDNKTIDEVSEEIVALYSK